MSAKLKCPVCGGEMVTEHTIGTSFNIDDDEHGCSSTDWFAVMWDCPKGCSYAEDWYFDEEHRDFYEGATRNKQTYWFNPDTEEEIKRDDEYIIRVPGE